MIQPSPGPLRLGLWLYVGGLSDVIGVACVWRLGCSKAWCPISQIQILLGTNSDITVVEGMEWVACLRPRRLNLRCCPGLGGRAGIEMRLFGIIKGLCDSLVGTSIGRRWVGKICSDRSSQFSHCQGGVKVGRSRWSTHLWSKSVFLSPF